MRENKIKAIHGDKLPRVIVGRPPILAPDRLQRAFTVEQPDQVWMTGIT